MFEVGEFQGQPYALEYVDGGSLAGRLDGQPLPPRKAARVAESLARAAHAVHELQLIHRDLKPANVLLLGKPDEPIERCTPKISDFGLAKMLDGAAGAGLTREGAVMGTPYYMAPEQAAGRVSEIDRRADVYSLGAILYEMLTGRPPLKGETVSETLWLVLNQEPASPRKLSAEVDRDLETICLKCLEKEPQRRFATALELADELERYQNDEPILTRRVGLAERALKWARRRPAAAAAWLLTLLALVLGSAGGLAGWQWLQAEAARGEAETARQQAEAAKQQAEDANAGLERQKQRADEAKGWALKDRLKYEQDLKEARGPAQQIEAAARRRFTQEFAATLRRANEGHYLRQIDLAHRCWRSGQLSQARTLLDAAPESARGWEYGYVDRLCHGSALPLPDGVAEGKVSHLAFSPDGSRLAAGCWDAVHVWDFPARTNRLTISQPSGWVAFSPDGSRLALRTEKGVRLVDAKTGKPAGELNDVAPNGARLAAFSPDGRRLAVVEYGSDSVVVYDLATSKPAVTLPGHGEGALMAAYSPDGSRLVTATAGGFRLWDAAGGKELRSVKADTSWHWWPLGFSPDGRRVACIDGVLVRSWDVASGQLIATGDGRQPIVRTAAVLPGGQLVSGGSDATVRTWDAASGGASGCSAACRPRSITPPDPRGRPSPPWIRKATRPLWDATADQRLASCAQPGGVTAVAFVEGGGRVASLNPRGVRLIETATGRQLWEVPGRWSRVAGGSRWLAVSGDDGLVVLDAATGREAWGEKGKVGGAAFSPDGSRLLVAGERLTLREAASGKKLFDYLFPWAGPVAFAKDGRRFAAAAPDLKEVLLFAVESSTFRRRLNGTRGSRLAFSPDGKRLAEVAGDVVTVWDADAGRPAFRLPHVSLVEAAAFSPDGRRLATAGWDRVVQVWDVEKGEAALTLPGHTGVIRDVSFSPDGRWLASGDGGTLRLWDAMGRGKGKVTDGEAKGRRDADVPRR
ncbi:MAG: protein kinase [Gemmataceae bacterium]